MSDYSHFAANASTSNAGYTLKNMAASFHAMRRYIEWAEYEVAPEWRRFCSFGPEDIGTVWEEIGAIRKRPKYAMIYIAPDVAKKLEDVIERQILGVSACVSEYLPPGTAYLIPDMSQIATQLHGIPSCQPMTPLPKPLPRSFVPLTFKTGLFNPFCVETMPPKCDKR